MARNSDSAEYKKRLIRTWNEIAPRYHRRWAKDGTGPFKSTSEVVKLAGIHPDSIVLDLACGTGAVTRSILPKIGPTGHVVGVDASYTAIKIARKQNRGANADFVLADAEQVHFNDKFDAVICQYALFFFPDAQRALRSVRRCMKKNATLALAVHGNGNTVPFFSSITDVVTQYVPDYFPKNAPSLDRFGTKTELKSEIARAGFSGIKIRQYCFEYSPGTFADYWSGYLRYLATPIKQKLHDLGRSKLAQIREEVKQKTALHTKKDGIVVFPWKVLILTARAP